MALGLSLPACSLRDYSYLTAGLEDSSGDTSDGTTGETQSSSGESSEALDAGPEGGVDGGTTDGGGTETSEGPDTGASSTTETTETTDTSSGTESSETGTSDGGDAEPVNLIPSGSFEDGYVGWSTFGNAILSRSKQNPHGGEYCLRTSGRTTGWMGPSFELLATLEAGKLYQATAWVRVDVPEPTDAGEEFLGAVVKMSVKYKCLGQTDNDAAYETLNQHTNVQDSWVQVTAVVDGAHPLGAPKCPDESPAVEYALYFEGTAEVDIYLDDVTLFEL